MASRSLWVSVICNVVVCVSKVCHVCVRIQCPEVLEAYRRTSRQYNRLKFRCQCSDRHAVMHVQPIIHEHLCNLAHCASLVVWLSNSDDDGEALTMCL